MKQRRSLDEAFESWFQAALADPPEGVRRILRRRSKGTTSRARCCAARSAISSSIAISPRPGGATHSTGSGAIDTIMEQLIGVGSLASQKLVARRLPHPQSRRDRALRRGERARSKRCAVATTTGSKRHSVILPAHGAGAGRGLSEPVSALSHVTRCWPAATTSKTNSTPSSRPATPILRRSSTRRCSRRSAPMKS